MKQIFVHKTHYQLQKKLGHGHFGDVYLAKRIENDRIYDDETFAIKLIKRDRRKRRQIDSIQNEINIMKKVKHYGENMITLLDYGSTYLDEEECFAIVMEYCNGATFEEYLGCLPGHKLSEEEAYYWFEQLMKIYRDLIHCKIIHRDIKPKNILLHYPTAGSLPILKIADFGCSKMQNDRWSTTASFKGTGHYIAPEMLRENSYNNSVDMWSIAIVFYRMLNHENQHPFHGKTLADLYREIQHKVLEIPMNLSQDLQVLLRGMFAKSVEERYSFNDIYSSKWCRRMRYEALPKVIEMRDYVKNKRVPNTKKLKRQSIARVDKYGEVLENGDVLLEYGGKSRCDYNMLVSKYTIEVTYGGIDSKIYSVKALPLTFLPKYHYLYRCLELAQSELEIVVNFVYTDNGFRDTLDCKAMFYKTNELGYKHGDIQIVYKRAADKMYYVIKGELVEASAIDTFDREMVEILKRDIYSTQGRLANTNWKSHNTIKYDMMTRVYYH